MILRKPRYTDKVYYAIYHYESGKTVINRCINSACIDNGLRKSDLYMHAKTKLAELRRNKCKIISEVYNDTFMQIKYTKHYGKIVATATYAIVIVDREGNISCSDEAKDAGVLDWVWTVPKTHKETEGDGPS